MAAGERLSISSSQNMKHILAFLGLLAGTVAAHCQPARVYSDAGSIFIERTGGTTRLTASEMDADPVLSPSGTFVVYTRQGRGRSRRHYEPHQFCPLSPGLTNYGASIWTAAMTGSCSRAAVAIPSTSSAISKASNSAPTAGGSISLRRLGQHQTRCTCSTREPVRNISCCPPMISWSSISAGANIKIT